MNYRLDENSTRRGIIQHLKKTGGMSIDQLAKEIGITPMGVRQHLLALEKKGLVSYVAKRRGIGRPGFIYMLTDTAKEFFPHRYDSLALEILKDLRKHDGPAKIEKIFLWRKERLLRASREALAGLESLDDRLNGLMQHLEGSGHFAELSRNNGHYHLKQYHCPIQKVSLEFREPCRYELQMYRELISKSITREQTLSEGATCCLYIIPRA